MEWRKKYAICGITLTLIMILYFIIAFIHINSFKDKYFKTICNYNNTEIFYQDYNGNNITLHSKTIYTYLKIKCYVSRNDRYDIILDPNDYTHENIYNIMVYFLIFINLLTFALSRAFSYKNVNVETPNVKTKYIEPDLPIVNIQE